MKLNKILSYWALLVLTIILGCENKSKKDVDDLAPIYKEYNTDKVRLNDLDSIERQLNDYENIKIIELGDKESEQINASSIIDTCWYVALETKEESLFGKVDKILIEDDLIFILDEDGTKSIFIFDMNGKFISKINKHGRGPDEYSAIRDFTLDSENRQVIVFDDFLAKLFYYRYDGTFVKTEKTFFRFREFSKLGSNTYYYLGSADNKHYPFLEENFIVKQNKGKFIETAIENPQYKFIRLEAQNQVQVSGNHLSFAIPVMDNHIYNIVGENVVPSFKLDFGDGTIKPSDLNKKYQTKIMDAVKEDKKCLFAGMHCETNKTLYFRYIEKGVFMNCYFNKKSGNLKIIKNTIPDLSSIMTPVESPAYAIYDEDVFVSLIDPQLITMNKDYVNHESSNKTKKLKSLVNSVKNTDNVVLCFHKLKDF
ncbi:6-bladed beta-propeller [Neotamlana sargassicola]|nr:6-bladed beta-propeller [Tamlana sargassicola]